MIRPLALSQLGKGIFSLWFSLALLAVALCAFSFTQVGYYMSSPSDEPVKSDLIVALGGDTGARIVKVHDLYAHGFASHILLTGMANSFDETRPAYLNRSTAFLVEGGVTQDALLYDTQSRNTWEEAVNTRSLLETKGWRSVLVVSDPPHMRRLSWVWNKVFDGTEMSFRLISVSMPQWDAAHWWQQSSSATYVLRELIKLGYYHVAY